MSEFGDVDDVDMDDMGDFDEDLEADLEEDLIEEAEMEQRKCFEDDEHEFTFDETYEGEDEKEEEKVKSGEQIGRKSMWKTFNRLTKYEMAALIGFRAQQIAEGSKPYVDLGRLNLQDPSTIAEAELTAGLMPLMLERPLPSNKIGLFTTEVRPLDSLYNVYQIR